MVNVNNIFFIIEPIDDSILSCPYERRIQTQSAGVTGREVLMVSRASEPVAVAEMTGTVWD